jgi:hypothetical protein
MKNRQNSKTNQNLEDDLLPEYNFDYSKARPNRFPTHANERNKETPGTYQRHNL